jgi:hypothetical protein
VRVSISGASDASGLMVSISDHDRVQTTTTGADGAYGFWCGDDDLCRIFVHADSTLERDLAFDFRGGDGVAPPADVVFTGVGDLEGFVTSPTGSRGILVAIEGHPATAVTDDAGHYVLTGIPADV